MGSFNQSDLCPCLKVVYACNHRNLRLSSRTRGHIKKTHRAFLVFFLSLKHVGLNNDLWKEIRICSTTSPHVFTCLVLFEQLSLPGWSPWPKPRYPGTQLAGRHPESQRRSPLPRHAENTKMNVGEPYLQGCLLAVISPVLKVFPLEKKRSTMFFLCFGNSSRTSREPSPKILVRIGVEK